MRFSVLLLATVVAVALGEMSWADFKGKYNRNYGSTATEAHHEQCFYKNLGKIAAANAVDTAHYAINEYGDLCEEDFKSYHNLRVNASRVRNEARRFTAEQIKAAADSVDWRSKGAVTDIKNQGQCGSCWAFSAAANMEGQHFLAGNTLVSLSVEELVQCSPSPNQGCNGGLMDDAFDWVTKNGGITTWTDYPYTSGAGVTGTCQTAKLKNVAAKFDGHQDIAKDETQMATWVASNGPLSVAVDAGILWQLYAGGVKTSCVAGQLDHGVLIVGYGTSEAGVPYWIVKNSWGAGWGESGYIRLKRGVNCNGINEAASSAKR